jgi:amidohydrolase
MTVKEFAYLKGIRHDIHRRPELGFEEHETSRRIVAEIENVGLKYKAGLAGGTGVVAVLPATESGGTTIALRADIDALPIFEQTGLPYASEIPGKMHACGHDGHTTMLIGAMRALAAETSRPNHITFMFQPAEEGGGGGEKMVEDGCLSAAGLADPAEWVFGLHGWPAYKVGEMTSRPGPMMASTNSFEVVVRGRGSHAAFPHVGIDPIVAASHIVTALQTIPSRNVDPLDSMVITIGAFHAGTASNIIPMEARLLGTLRTLNADTRELGRRRIREVVQGIATSLGCEAEIIGADGYPVTINHPEAYRYWRDVIGSDVPDLAPVMGAEDFSYYGPHAKACFFALGIVPHDQDDYPNLHAPTFDFNDDAIPVGVDAFVRLSLHRR